MRTGQEMILLMLSGLIPSFLLAVFIARRKHSLPKGVVAGMILLTGWSLTLATLLVINGDPPQPGAKTITREEMKSWNTSSEQTEGELTSDTALSPASKGSHPQR
jgi:hypothetical protein